MSTTLDPIFARLRNANPFPGISEALRAEARELLEELGLPSRAEDAWRFTNPASLWARHWELAPDESSPAAESLVQEASIAGLDAPRLVLVDGRYRPELSHHDLPEGVELTTKHPEELPDHAVGLMTASALTGAVHLRVTSRTQLTTPILVQSVVSSASAGALSATALTLEVGEGAAVSVLVDRFGPGEVDGLALSSTRAHVATNARLDLINVVREPEAFTHLNESQIFVDRDAWAGHRSLVVGGGTGRNAITAHLRGPGAECQLDGLVVANQNQHVDHQLLVCHEAPHTQSHQNYRNVLDGRARGVFGGRVKVAREAQKTDATQNNRNLLLSEHAVMNTMPQLEIYADDVKCSHGATLGRLDERALFYLRSRGIDEREARNLLLFAFASEVLDAVRPEALAQLVRQEVLRRLPRQALLEEAG